MGTRVYVRDRDNDRSRAGLKTRRGNAHKQNALAGTLDAQFYNRKLINWIIRANPRASPRASCPRR